MDVSWSQTEHWLKAVGYYRLSGYWHPYRVVDRRGQVGSNFMPGTSMQNIAALYEFDRKLKNHFLSGLERVEIACRSRIADLLGERDGNAIMNPAHFRDVEEHHRMMGTIQSRIQRAVDSKDPVALHHQEAYDGTYPIWATMEFLDFGDVSKILANLREDDKESVARWFGWAPPSRHPEAKLGATFQNWLRHLTVVRNTAAHHARLWNRTFEPTSARGLRMIPALAHLRGQQDKISGTASVMVQLIGVTSPGSSWIQQPGNLIANGFEGIEGVSCRQMGFEDDWKETPPFT